MLSKSYILAFILFPLLLWSQTEKKHIVVGTKIAEPFVLKNNAGEWKGLSFELWNRISRELDFSYEVKSYNLEDLLKAVANREIDIAVSPLTVTSEREKLFDFTHSYFTTGLSIALKNKQESSFIHTISKIFSTQFLNIILVMMLVLFVVGFLVWLFERNKNISQFGDGMTKGLGSSFWWAAVTMTTVGYGDKAPKTVGGRLIALIWMFAGLVMISGFTAAITSALTIDQLDEDIKSVNDLYDVRVGTVNGSSSEEYLNQNGVSYIKFANLDEGIDLLKNDKIDAFVYDAPILKFHIKSKNISNEIKIMPVILDPINYAFALPSNSPLRETINRVLLKEIDQIEWTNIINTYIGR